MEKKHLKRLGYGFSALVLALSAVAYFPANKTYADPVADPELSDPADPAEPGAPAADPADPEVPAADSEELEEPEEPAGNPEEPGELDSDAPVLGSSIGDDDEDEEEEAAPSFESNVIVRAISTEEPFMITAAPGSYVMVWDMTESDEEEYDMMRAIPVGDMDYIGGYGAGYGGFGNMRLAGPEDISVEETEDGEFAVVATTPGIYWVTLNGHVAETNTFMSVSATLTAINTETEAAATVKDVLNENFKDGKAMWEASKEYFRQMWTPGLTEEERQAAEEEYWETVSELETSIELRTYNTFGDDSDIIMAAVNSGKTISTEVVVESLEEADVDEEAKDALLDSLDITFASNVKFYDVKVVVYADGEEIGTLKELTNKETVVISGFTGPEAGYRRVFKVLAFHTRYDENGEAYTEVIEIDDVDFDEESGAILFGADRFSTYLVSYKDVFAPSVDTGVFTGEGGSATASTALSVVAIATLITLAGVVKIAKARK